MKDIKRELRCIDSKKIMIFIAISAVFCVVSHLFCSGMDIYYIILLPVFAVPVQIFGAIRLIMFALLGFAAGMAVSGCLFCSKQEKRMCIILYFLLLTVSALWAPVVFGLASFIIGLLLSVMALVLCYLVITNFLNTSVIGGYSVILFALWNLYCFFLNFCIILLN